MAQKQTLDRIEFINRDGEADSRANWWEIVGPHGDAMLNMIFEDTIRRVKRAYFPQNMLQPYNEPESNPQDLTKGDVGGLLNIVKHALNYIALVAKADYDLKATEISDLWATMRMTIAADWHNDVMEARKFRVNSKTGTIVPTHVKRTNIDGDTLNAIYETSSYADDLKKAEDFECSMIELGDMVLEGQGLDGKRYAVVPYHNRVIENMSTGIMKKYIEPSARVKIKAKPTLNREISATKGGS